MKRPQRIFLTGFSGSGKVPGLLVLAAIAGLLAACGGESPSLGPPPAGKIAFLRFAPGPPANPLPPEPSDIYVVNADGAGLTNLTNHQAGYGPLSWSPDGTRLLFSSDREGNGEIYVMSADGSGLTNLTNDTSEDFSPTWSPDGTKIAFASFREGNPGLFVMDADGFEASHLTDDVTVHISCAFAWSPDGEKITFVSHRDGNPEIYIINVDGSGLTRLTDDPYQDWCPSWSPDGEAILFQRGAFPPNDIHVMNADGSGVTNLTNTGYQDRDTGHDDLFPAWSPDGTRIIFRSNRDGFAEFYIMNADGSDVTRVTSTHGEADSPSWATNSSHITVEIDGDIYVIDADGSGKTKLTDGRDLDGLPVWSPMQSR